MGACRGQNHWVLEHLSDLSAATHADGHNPLDDPHKVSHNSVPLHKGQASKQCDLTGEWPREI